MKTYSELLSLRTFLERYRYLQLFGTVGTETFGSNRYLNQIFYNCDEWRSLRDKIIARDRGLDLGIEGKDIYDNIIVHHINPITKDDILRRNKLLFDPENLICTSLNTHRAIHYGDEGLLTPEPVIRTKNDTCPWKHD